MVLVDIQHPLEIDPVTQRYSKEFTCVYYLYERPAWDHQGNIAPSIVTSFGTAPLTADNVATIVDITGVAVDNLVPCDAAHAAVYNTVIPAHLLLRRLAADDHVNLGTGSGNTAREHPSSIQSQHQPLPLPKSITKRSGENVYN